LEAVQVMKNIHRMNRSKVSRAQALLAAPSLLAAEALDQHTLEVLQMKDELERLGLSSLLSERFGQMVAEIELLAASA
ncbi:MAG: hypothetical protein KBC91_04940, partial [Candidatus Omnitrophica bacterium]|nr:hypothetical protein [Candidatus Omnitrophota bacterium]